MVYIVYMNEFTKAIEIIMKEREKAETAVAVNWAPPSLT